MIRMLPLTVLLVACGGKDDTNNGFTTTQTSTQTEGSCELLEERAVAIDEFIGEPLNFAAENALGELTGVTNTTNVLEWPDGTTINVEVEFVYTDGALMYRERDTVGILGQDELARCFTAIEIDGEFSFTSGDGMFDEVFTGTLQAKKRREGVFLVVLDGSTLTGAWTPEASGIDSASYGAFELEFDGAIEPGGSDGVITAISGEDALPAGAWAPPPTQG